MAVEDVTLRDIAPAAFLPSFSAPGVLQAA